MPLHSLQTIPIFRIFDPAKARQFYLDFLGFTLDWEHRFDEKAPLYMPPLLNRHPTTRRRLAHHRPRHQQRRYPRAQTKSRTHLQILGHRLGRDRFDKHAPTAVSCSRQISRYITMPVLRVILPAILLVFLGCSATQPSPPSKDELQEDARLKLNEEQATRLLDSGAIQAGQDVYEFLKLCQPYRVDFVDRFTFVEFYSVPGLYGLSFIAIDGKLVSARRWSCTKSDVLFETINQAEKQAAYAAYEARLFGYQR